MTKLTCQQTESFLYKNPYPLTHLSSHVSRCKSAKFTNAHGYDTPSITTHSLYTPRDISIDYTLNEGRPRVTSITSIPTARQLYSNVHEFYEILVSPWEIITLIPAITDWIRPNSRLLCDVFSESIVDIQGSVKVLDNDFLWIPYIHGIWWI